MKRAIQGFCSIILFFLPHAGLSQNFPARGSALISHLSADYGQAGDEFVVLFNATSDTIDLNGLELRYFTASGSPGSAGRSFTVSTRIPPLQHMLVASHDTVRVGAITVLSDDFFSSGMATTGGQMVLRSSSVPDSIIFACAWGTVTQYVAGMSDAAVWNGDGMITLMWQDSSYQRTSYNRNNVEYHHVLSDSIIMLPSTRGIVTMGEGSAWYIQISIAQGTYCDSSVVIGSAPGASAGFDPGYDAPMPPPPPGTAIRTGVYRPDLTLVTGDHLLHDIRPSLQLTDTTHEWIIDVWPAEAGVQMNIVLDVSSVPAFLPAQVRDMDTGERYERSGSHVSFLLSPSTTDPYRFRIVAGDTTPPGVHFMSPASDTVVGAGSHIQVIWSFTETSGIDSTALSLADIDGHHTYAILDTTSEIHIYTWTLPPRLLTDSAFFRLFIRDSMGNHRVYHSDGLRIVPDTARILLGSGWHSFSVPLEPVGAQPFIASEDSLFVFTYHPRRGYVKTSTVTPGSGYFIGVMTEKHLRIPGIAHVDSLTRPLQQGFALISGLGNSSLSKEDLLFESGGMKYPYGSAVSNSVIGNGFYGYDHISGQYYPADSILPWKAYWLPVLAQTVSVRFSRGNVQGSSRMRPVTGEDWEVRFRVLSGAITDSLFSIGVHSGATDGFDALFDIPAPPPPPEGPPLQVYAERPEWEVPTGTRFLTDIRNGDSLASWRFTVETSGPMDVTKLSTSVRGHIPSGIEIRDASHSGYAWMPLHEKWSYAFAGSRKRTFDVRMTATAVQSSDVDGPRDFSVSQNYPNPFNGTTRVSIAIPWRGRLAVRVYDLLGRVVFSNSVQECEPGQWIWEWSAELSSGTYIGEAELSSHETGERFIRRLRMVLMK